MWRESDRTNTPSRGPTWWWSPAAGGFSSSSATTPSPPAAGRAARFGSKCFWRGRLVILFFGVNRLHLGFRDMLENTRSCHCQEQQAPWPFSLSAVASLWWLTFCQAFTEIGVAIPLFFFFVVLHCFDLWIRIWHFASISLDFVNLVEMIDLWNTVVFWSYQFGGVNYFPAFSQLLVLIVSAQQNVHRKCFSLFGHKFVPIS